MSNETESITVDGFRLLSKVIKALLGICDRRYSRSTSRVIAHYHCARALGLLQGIEVLLKSELPWQAAVLNRSLLNLLINFAWLTSGYSKARLEWFADCEVLTKRANIESLFCMGEMSVEQYRLNIEQVQPDWDEFCCKYGYVHHGKPPPVKWAPKSIKGLAYDLKDDPKWWFLWQDYESAYRFLSGEEHTDPRAVQHHLDLESGWSRMREVSEDQCVAPLVESGRYGIGVLLASNRLLKSQRDVFDSLSVELGKLQDRVKPRLRSQLEIGYQKLEGR